jgi:hypothetical protein
MIMKTKLVICLMAISVALAGYVSCLIASHIRWGSELVSAPAILPGLSFGVTIAAWLLHRGWIGRAKAAGLAVGAAGAYFAAYWSAFYTFKLCSEGMLFATLRLALFHAGMIAGLVGTTILIASLAAVSGDFRRKGWKTLLLIGTAAGGALCLAGIGANSGNPAGTLANPGDRLFIFAWQLLVGGYIGMLLWRKAESAPSATALRSRSAHRARQLVLVFLVVSFVQAAVGYSRREKKGSTSSATSDNSNAHARTPARADTQKEPPVSQHSSPSPFSQSDKDLAKFLVILSGETPKPQAQASRSETSHAVERYLRFRLIGGATNNQIIALSDAIGEKFDTADLPPKQRGYCLTGTGDQRQVLLYMLDQVARGELSPPEAQAAAKRLLEEIPHMIPPRIVFDNLFGNHAFGSSDSYSVKPLPAIDGPIGHGYRLPGSLAHEYLAPSLENVIHSLISDDAAFERTWEKARELRGADVLECWYQGAFKDTGWRRYFWYKQYPTGFTDLLKNFPADHPIRKIGPALQSAPATLELALQVNPHSVEELRKAIAEEKTRAERGPASPELTNAEKFWTALGILAAGLAAQDIEDQKNTKALIESSGGKKIECPECRGTGLVPNYNYDTFHPYYESNGVHDSNANPTHLTCPKCGGTRVINK